jgi:uncharacterized protein YjbI with pentapeptide repeats
MATELSSQQEQVAEEGVPVCDACREYKCKLKLPGEFAGAYLSMGDEKNGTLCILHCGDPHKDAEKCARAVEDKISNKDFDFWHVLFSCPVRFHGEMENANFSGATFAGAAEFVRATFSGNADFERATFSGNATFWRAKFSGAANFEMATFSSTAHFLGARFSGTANFLRATFSVKADFRLATFNGKAYFRMATFSGAVDFHGVTFSGAADFVRATFSGAADFSVAWFKEAALLESLAKSRDDERDPTDRRVRLNFQYVTLDKPDKIHFRDVDMAEVAFRETDVRKVEFSNVQWPQWLREEREAEQGEARLQTTKERKDRLAAVEKLCHQLRQNYEDQRNYPDAGRFYYGEMEMRRKGNFWRRYLPSLTTLYWLSSGYGQRPWRAFVWTVALLSSFSLLYMVTGLKIEGAANPSFPATVNWPELSATWTSFRELWMSLRSWGRNFGYAALHTLQVLTFSRIRTFTPLDWHGELLIVLQTVILPLQVALLALAVRRRFQR